ncbi:TraI/MobA(P) family conjugative relaxase [Azohydromonas lata]|uniref:TraI/MobA(P) family conjugative relaxase n=1 Tax=Azohydromonas lata TaxID=45677 RepID=A0ABU5IK95_9BURK|nr:TraI/MobA(P) family conjugative relaxase [Azohydromonas lata]MDZ5459306.1 TraI/MobA(P) family conjugative relaxase [Azohydromonas lata]
MIAKHVAMRSPSRSSMADLVSYLSDDQGLHERVGDIRITNCASATLDAAVAEMLATQQLNTRAKGDRTYHLLVSFQAGEQPTPEQLQAIEQRICDALGLGEHQRVSVVHHDTDNLHIHLAINKIHPRRLTFKEPFQSYRTLARVCAKLEREFGLKADNHTPRRSTAEGRAADMEQHAGIESLMSWVRRECLADMQRVGSWAEMHEVLAAHGLRIHERGAGLSIEADDGTRVRASTVDRGLSKQSLEERLGRFQASSASHTGHPRKTYAYRPKRTRVDTTELFARYQRERDSAYETRVAELAAAKRSKDLAVENAHRVYRLHAATLRVVDGRGIDKRLLYAQASRNLKNKLREIHEDYGRQRQRIVAAHGRRAWADWLKSQATKGDAEALAALRARSEAENLHGATIRAAGQATGVGAAPDIDTVTKAGTVVYRTGSSAVRDDGQRLQVSREADKEAVRAALRLARQQYGDRITVTGSIQFKAAVVRAAVDLGLPITFTDPGLERHRQVLMQKEYPNGYPQPEPGRRAAGPRDGGLHRQRPANPASGHARRAVQPKPDARRAGAEPPPRASDRLRNLSELGVVRQRQGGQELLPGDVRGGVEHEGTQRADAVRRSIHRPGGSRGSGGRGRGVSQPPPPVARARGAVQAKPARRPPLDKTPPPQARVRPQAAPQAQRATVEKPRVAKVGTKPPPGAAVRLRPLSAVDPGQRGPVTRTPASPAAPAPAATAGWSIPGAIFSPAAYTAADKYIAERESKRARGLDVPRHTRYTAGAGPLTYAGTRTVDGQLLALLKRGDEVLVMPIDATTAQRLARTGLGTPAKVNANATISTGTGRGLSR